MLGPYSRPPTPGHNGRPIARQVAYQQPKVALKGTKPFVEPLGHQAPALWERRAPNPQHQQVELGDEGKKVS
jgi:hypothetical protein